MSQEESGDQSPFPNALTPGHTSPTPARRTTGGKELFPSYPTYSIKRVEEHYGNDFDDYFDADYNDDFERDSNNGFDEGLDDFDTPSTQPTKSEGEKRSRVDTETEVLSSPSAKKVKGDSFASPPATPEQANDDETSAIAAAITKHLPQHAKSGIFVVQPGLGYHDSHPRNAGYFNLATTEDLRMLVELHLPEFEAWLECFEGDGCRVSRLA